MTTALIEPPFPLFTDSKGEELNNGKVYIGTAGADAESNPITVYWDSALSIPAAQPLLTLNGYIVRGTSPSKVWVGSDYSIKVKDKNDIVVSSSLAGNLFTNVINASQIVFDPTGPGATATTVESRLRVEGVYLTDFDMKGDGSDESAKFALAIAAVEGTGKILYGEAGKDYNMGLTVTRLATGNFQFDGRNCTLTDHRWELDDTCTDTQFRNFTTFKASDADFTGGSINFDYHGFVYLRGQNTVIDNVRFTRYVDAGITKGRNCLWPYTGCVNLRISNCYFGPGAGCLGVANGRDIVIDNCVFDKATTDDCIALKALAGGDTDGVVISNCVMRDVFGALSLGSNIEENGFIRNVTLTNCVCENTAVIVDFRGGYESTGALNSGGYINSVTVSNCSQIVTDPTLDYWRAVIKMNVGYDTVIDGVSVSDCVASVRNGSTNSRGYIDVTATSQQGHIGIIRNVSIKDCEFYDITKIPESVVTGGEDIDYGIFFEKVDTEGTTIFQNWEIRDCKFSDADRRGISADTGIIYDNVIIERNKFFNCGEGDRICLAQGLQGMKYIDNEVQMKSINYAVATSTNALGERVQTGGEIFSFPLGDFPTGTALTKTLNIPCRNGYSIIDARVSSASTIALDGTDYNTYKLKKCRGERNMGDSIGTGGLLGAMSREITDIRVPSGVSIAGLDQKYFVLDSHIGTVAFWFADAFQGPSDAEPTEPAHGADFSVKIPIMSVLPTDEQQNRPDPDDVDDYLSIALKISRLVGAYSSGGKKMFFTDLDSNVVTITDMFNGTRTWCDVTTDGGGLEALKTVVYDNETGDFTVGLVVTGGSSGGSGTIDSLTDSGTTGNLVLSSFNGTIFTNNETITDTSTGSASVNRTGYFGSRDTGTSSLLKTIGDKTATQNSFTTETEELKAYVFRSIFERLGMHVYETNNSNNDESIIFNDERLMLERTITGTGSGTAELDVVVEVEVIRF